MPCVLNSLSLFHVCVLLAALARSTEPRKPVIRGVTATSFMSSGVHVYEAADLIGANERKTWLVQLPSGWSTDMLKMYGQGSPGEVVWRGHPSEKGASTLVYQGTKSELEQCLQEHPGALWAEESFEVHAYGMLNSLRNSSDRRLSQQTVSERLWGLDRIDAQNGLDQVYDNADLTGDGVHVYVLDTGIRTSHTEFEDGRAIADLDVFLGRRCRGDPNCAADGNGHGTHCAGTVAGRTAGVAKNAIVHAVKVLSDDGSGSTAGVLAAIDYVASEGQRPAVISMSLGCVEPCRSPAEDRAIEAAIRAGVTVVVAAGNNGNTPVPDACDYAPASNPQAITVGSTTIDDDRSTFSNIGECVDVFAPGSNILSASHLSDTAGRTLSGTSMACPHVAGVAALVLGKNPALEPSEVSDVIIRTAQIGRVNDARGTPNRLLYMASLSTELEVAAEEHGMPHGAVVALTLGIVCPVLFCCAIFTFYKRAGRLPHRPKEVPKTVAISVAVLQKAVQSFKELKNDDNKKEEASANKERPHDWSAITFYKPKWCEECDAFLWGFTNQGFSCTHCGKIVCAKCALHGSQLCEVTV